MRSDSDGTKTLGQAQSEAFGEIGYLLFDSLAHYLIEKGVLTKNDALSVVKTVADVVQGRIDDGETPPERTRAALSILQRTYSSFEAVRDQHGGSELDGHNVHPLRPSRHDDRSRFLSDD